MMEGEATGLGGPWRLTEQKQLSDPPRDDDKNPRTSLRYARGILVPLRATHDLELALSANLHPRATSRGFKIGEE